MEPSKDLDSAQKMWDAYNYLMLSQDLERLRKLMAREELFRMTLEVPGDIVECGVMKGVGLAQLVKMKEIFCPGSLKEVIGFDLFGAAPTGGVIDGDANGAGKSNGVNNGTHVSQDGPNARRDDAEIRSYFEECGVERLDAAAVERKINAIDGKTSVKLVAGDVRKTCKEFVDSNPGFKISFLNLDLDLAEPTLKALEALWPRVSVGGVVVFDEYAISRWSESLGVDAFFRDKPEVTLKALKWARTPTAYVVKGTI